MSLRCSGVVVALGCRDAMVRSPSIEQVDTIKQTAPAYDQSLERVGQNQKKIPSNAKLHLNF